MYDFTENHVFVKQIFANGLNSLKNGEEILKLKKRQGRLTRVNTTEMVYSVNLAGRSITWDDISEQMVISSGTADWIVHDLAQLSLDFA